MSEIEDQRSEEIPETVDTRVEIEPVMFDGRIPLNYIAISGQGRQLILSLGMN